MIQNRLMSNKEVFKEGIKDGIPICLGYFVVSFALGIVAKSVGLTPFQGFLTSLLNNASAGEYAAFTVIMADATYLEMAIITLVANARYMLMSAVLSQKFSRETPFYHRIFVGFALTDEIFGISAARKGYLNPYYNYGAMLVALPGWSIGTAFGITAGNILPNLAISALSVALYGMFLAIIIPPAKEEKAIRIAIIISFIFSFIFVNLFDNISAGTRIILLTILISGVISIIFPLKEDK